MTKIFKLKSLNTYILQIKHNYTKNNNKQTIKIKASIIWAGNPE